MSQLPTDAHNSADTLPEVHTITLQQALQIAGFVDTGGEAKQRIQDGEVRVNGVPETRRKRKLKAGDVVQLGEQEMVLALDDEPVPNPLADALPKDS